MLAGSMLEVACREMGLALTREQLQEGCSAALRTIHEGELLCATLGMALLRVGRSGWSGMGIRWADLPTRASA